MSSVKAVTLFLCLATSLFGQTVTVFDDSPRSPVALRGTVSFATGPINPLAVDDTACFLTGYNKSSKGIIASSVELTFVRPSGEPAEAQYEMDHFFGTPLVSLPQADYPIASGTADCQTGHEVGVERIPQPPEAHARLLFVQYEDGSYWGDAKVGARLMTQRAETLEFLQSLKNAYTTSGLEGLSVALAIEQKPGTMAWLKVSGLRKIRDASGLSAVADRIDKNLAMAEVRKAALVK
jgi:hypothetical protein